MSMNNNSDVNNIFSKLLDEIVKQVALSTLNGMDHPLKSRVVPGDPCTTCKDSVSMVVCLKVRNGSMQILKVRFGKQWKRIFLHLLLEEEELSLCNDNGELLAAASDIYGGRGHVAKEMVRDGHEKMDNNIAALVIISNFYSSGYSYNSWIVCDDTSIELQMNNHKVLSEGKRRELMMHGKRIIR